LLLDEGCDEQHPAKFPDKAGRLEHRHTATGQDRLALPSFDPKATGQPCLPPPPEGAQGRDERWVLGRDERPSAIHFQNGDRLSGKQCDRRRRDAGEVKWPANRVGAEELRRVGGIEDDERRRAVV
jgi:hypothetical protein